MGERKEPDAYSHAGVARQSEQALCRGRRYNRQERVEVIVRIVAKLADVDPRAMHGDGRTKPIVEARFAARWLARMHCPEMSGAKLARMIANADHTTFRHAIIRTKEFMADPQHPVSILIAAAAPIVDEALRYLAEVGNLHRPDIQPVKPVAPVMEAPSDLVRASIGYVHPKDGAIIMHPWSV